MRYCVDKLENEYFDWLEETCKCDIPEDGCGCLDFDDWFEEKQQNAIEGTA